jgi:energy-coupling factor transporter ATP-binding protein EcfA2
MTASPLSIHGLTFSYPAFGVQPVVGEPPRPLLDGLSFGLEQGETGILAGPADAGKTTLARILVGLVPRFTGGRLSGEIRCGDIDVLGSKPYDLLERIGLVFQDSEQQIFTTRCDTEIAFALESLGVARAEMGERIDRSLELAGLSAFRRRNPATLSGGEKKRLLVACLAAIDPSVWVLDESLEELDAFWKVRILDALRARGATMLILDSRWSRALEQRGERFGLLARGSVALSSAPKVSPDFRRGLVEEGIVVEGRAGAAPRSQPARAPFLKAEGIRFSFPESPSESDGFTLDVDSLEIEKGAVCALVGPNGSGKSTLGRVLCGLLVPQKGRLWLDDGAGYRPAPCEELNRRVGYLFQNPDHQIYLPTVREELALGLKRKGVGRTGIDDLVREAIRLFCLPGPEAAPALMSYGGRRRLQAATYWLLEREMLILDEVDSGLSYRELASIMDELCARTPCIVLITHDEQFARSVSDRMLSMEAGRIVGDSRPGAN